MNPVCYAGEEWWLEDLPEDWKHRYAHIPETYNDYL